MVVWGGAGVGGSVCFWFCFVLLFLLHGEKKYFLKMWEGEGWDSEGVGSGEWSSRRIFSVAALLDDIQWNSLCAYTLFRVNKGYI